MAGVVAAVVVVVLLLVVVPGHPPFPFFLLLPLLMSHAACSEHEEQTPWPALTFPLAGGLPRAWLPCHPPNEVESLLSQSRSAPSCRPFQGRAGATGRGLHGGLLTFGFLQGSTSRAHPSLPRRDTPLALVPCLALALPGRFLLVCFMSCWWCWRASSLLCLPRCLACFFRFPVTRRWNMTLV